MSVQAVIDYYAVLIKRGAKTMDNVPEEDREAVKEALKYTPEPEFDPATMTPEIQGEIITPSPDVVEEEKN